MEFVHKEVNMRATLTFQIMRARNGEGPRGRSPPLSFKPKDVNLVGFISLINGSQACLNATDADMKQMQV